MAVAVQERAYQQLPCVFPADVALIMRNDGWRNTGPERQHPILKIPVAGTLHWTPTTLPRCHLSHILVGINAHWMLFGIARTNQPRRAIGADCDVHSNAGRSLLPCGQSATAGKGSRPAPRYHLSTPASRHRNSRLVPPPWLAPQPTLSPPTACFSTVTSSRLRSPRATRPSFPPDNKTTPTMQRVGPMAEDVPFPPSSPVSYQPRPSIFAPIIIIPMSVTPTHVADQAAAFNEFVPLSTPPPRYNDRFRRPSKRNLRQALERLETAYGPLTSHFPTPSTPSHLLTPSPPSTPIPISPPGPSPHLPYNYPVPPRRPQLHSPPSYADAHRLPPSYSSESGPDASTSSLIPGWDKHPVLDEPEPATGTKRPRRSLLDIIMPGLNRRRIFGSRRATAQT
ncbi:hypothetical protein CALVIDRAFT_205965 [Calocera viscosa TUFC12733]|uniref:Uncharacterized protein n=1 Tax=Calocera viscosa (strain TUFC12733) TaxID=1330018 RepID=A0A167KER3_CALVF|nr:hypothetical protein CALVIDRAFT_205965 [Calocera viscosa TUFC12733]